MVYKEKNMVDSVLVIAVHPDDETLGCGATLLKYKASGANIHWLIITEDKVENGASKEDINARKAEIETVASMYGFSSVVNLQLATMHIDEYTMTELIGLISDVIKRIKPNILFLPFKSDVHSDHRKIFEAAYSCTKVFRYPFIKKIYMMETLSETEFAPGLKEDAFVPNVFVDISDFLERKIEIMKVFKTEIAEHPFPRSERNIYALASYRGAIAGCNYAESFMLIKEIN